MAHRPRLSADSFLSHLFRPSKNPLPTGIRKTQLSGLRGGRTKARLASFNKMPGKNQEVLRRSGNVDAYLRGEISLTEAKRQLRVQAVQKGIVKPLRQKPLVGGSAGSEAADIRATFVHIDKLVRTGRKNQRTIQNNTLQMTPHQRREARKIQTFDDYRSEASSSEGKWQTVFDDGHVANVLWYH